MVIPCLYSFLLTVLHTPSAEPLVNKKRTRTLFHKESGSSTNCMVGDASRLTLRLRASAPGSMAVYLDEACTRKAAEIPFPASTDWQEVQGSFSAPAGTFPLFFRLNCTGRMDWESFILT